MLKFKNYSRRYRNLFFFAVILLLACGPGLYDENEFLGYFMPQSAFTPKAASIYYYTPAFLYGQTYDYWGQDDYATSGDENLREWTQYAHVTVDDSTAAALIYQGKDSVANPLWQALQQHPSAWHYLLIARKIEKASAAGGNPWEPTPADTAAMRQLFKLVTDSAHTVSDPFLSDKYAFQSIKLAHELQGYDSCIQLYDRYFGQTTDSGAMKYWSLSRKAGALLDLGDTARAVYAFAQVFDHSRAKRQAAYMSLRLAGIRFVPEALQYCKNDREKAAVYTLCAIQPWQDALPLLKALVKITPDHPYLELIMSREINRNEDYYYADRDKQSQHYRSASTANRLAKKDQAGTYFARLKDFADICANNPKIKNPAFWNTAAAYISYVQGAYAEAEASLAKAEKEDQGSAALHQQILLQKLLLTTDKEKTISPAMEKEVLPLLHALKDNDNFYQNNALVLACDHLTALYQKIESTATEPASSWWRCNKPKPPSPWIQYAPAKVFLLQMLTTYQQNDSGGAFMSSRDQHQIEDTTSNATLDNVIGFLSQAAPSPEDKAFMQLTSMDLDYCYFVKGRRAIAVFDYATAAAAWQHVGKNFWAREPFNTYLSANPFTLPVADTHAPTKADTLTYTPYQFAARMLQLSEAVKKDADGAASRYYLLGCGAYNMSYHGNSWLLVKRYWSSADIPFETDKAALSLIDSLNYYTANQAKAYFDSAMRRAGDKELAARACFMAAKCEQKAFFVYCSRHDLWDGIAHDQYSAYQNVAYHKKRDSLRRIAKQVEDQHFHRYFKTLKNEYSTAQFNWEVIRECATYRDFVRGK